ncbi:unnamed protein product [Adineta ricciae]|uniref:MAM domain-containing protein n=1 Tax=Adineta ricciae TaxID=249248 RepID=A0A815TWD0_ADIRI|nr:unnamed protein product [Adineta ricciae]
MSLLLRFILLYYALRSHHVIVCPTVTCDFEIDECAWTLDSTWRIYPSGSTPDTASSGPTMDHTTGNGSYARFMGARLPDSSAFGLMSTDTEIRRAAPFSFWYFMHGSQIGTLTLFVNDEPVWSRSGRQGVPAWYQATVSLTPAEHVKLGFVANRTGLGRSSDIAIDDIVLQGEPSTSSTRHTRPTSTTTPRTRFNASCDFDVDKELCGWKSDTKYGWQVIEERASNITIGPSSDYSSITRSSDDGKFCKIPFEEKSVQYYYCTLNKKNLQCKGNDNKWFTCRYGGFVQIETSRFGEMDERSQFESPVLDALSDEGCIQFQYNIAGSDNDWLNVYVEDYWSGEQTCVWHMNGSSIPNRWVAAESPISVEKGGRYKIVFEARKGKVNGNGLVSLDHIVLSGANCSGRYPVIECPPEPTTPSTTSTTTTTVSSTTTSTTTTPVSSTTTSTTTTTASSTTMSTTTTTVSSTTTSTSTSTTTTTASTTSSSPVISSSFKISTSEPQSTTDRSTIAEVTTESVGPSTNTLPISSTEVTTTKEPVPEVSTSTTTSTTTTSTFSPTTTATPSSTSTIMTTTTFIDISSTDKEERKTTTNIPPSNNSRAIGGIVGSLVGVCVIVLLVALYFNHKKIRARLTWRSNEKDGIVPIYTKTDPSESFVRLQNIRERSTSFVN